MRVGITAIWLAARAIRRHSTQGKQNDARPSAAAPTFRTRCSGGVVPCSFPSGPHKEGPPTESNGSIQTNRCHQEPNPSIGGSADLLQQFRPTSHPEG